MSSSLYLEHYRTEGRNRNVTSNGPQLVTCHGPVARRRTYVRSDCHELGRDKKKDPHRSGGPWVVNLGAD
jgi:hypothetical protein